MECKETGLEITVYMQTLLKGEFVLAWSISHMSSELALFGWHWAAAEKHHQVPEETV
jgi:hypothetical protein